MKSAVVSMSSLSDRWDAGFHLALSELGARVEELRTTIPADEAVRRLSLLAVADKSSMQVLARGSLRMRADADALAREYPHLSLALVERDSEISVRRITAEIENGRQALETLLALGEPSVQPDADDDMSPKPF